LAISAARARRVHADWARDAGGEHRYYYYLLFFIKKGGIIMRTWRVASAKFEEKRPERQGKKSDVRGRKSAAKAAIRSLA